MCSTKKGDAEFLWSGAETVYRVEFVTETRLLTKYCRKRAKLNAEQICRNYNIFFLVFMWETKDCAEFILVSLRLSKTKTTTEITRQRSTKFCIWVKIRCTTQAFRLKISAVCWIFPYRKYILWCTPTVHHEQTFWGMYVKTKSCIFLLDFFSA